MPGFAKQPQSQQSQNSRSSRRYQHLLLAVRRLQDEQSTRNTSLQPCPHQPMTCDDSQSNSTLDARLLPERLTETSRNIYPPQHLMVYISGLAYFSHSGRGSWGLMTYHSAGRQGSPIWRRSLVISLISVVMIMTTILMMVMVISLSNDRDRSLCFGIRGHLFTGSAALFDDVSRRSGWFDNRLDPSSLSRRCGIRGRAVKGLPAPLDLFRFAQIETLVLRRALHQPRVSELAGMFPTDTTKFYRDRGLERRIYEPLAGPEDCR